MASQEAAHFFFHRPTYFSLYRNDVEMTGGGGRKSKYCKCGKKIKPVSICHLYAHPGGGQETASVFKDGPGHWARWPELSLYIRLTH